jgi:hypothetical protein
MARCAGIKRDGGRCTTVVEPSHTHCYQHDPDRAEERRRNASRAARSKPSREIVGVKAQLRDLARDVLAGDLETGRAAVANQLINTRLRAMDLEIKIRQADDLEARVEQLERSEKPEKGAHGTFG